MIPAEWLGLAVRAWGMIDGPDKHPDEAWQAYAHRLYLALTEARDHLWSGDDESAEATLTDALTPERDPWADLRAKPGHVAGSCVFVTPAGNTMTVSGSWDPAMWAVLTKVLPRSHVGDGHEAHVLEQVACLP